MSFECVSVNGFAGDRTPEAMLECHGFATAFSEYFGIPFELVGDPALVRDLPWDVALLESKITFEKISTHLRRILVAGHKPILITPRCASAIASIPVVVSEYPDVVILYFDAHGDMTTPESSDSGYLGGMPLSAALGEWDSGYGSGLKVSNLVHIGGRDFDQVEKEFVEANKLYTLSKCQIESDLTDLRTMVSGRSVYVHLDSDVFDPSEVTAEYAVVDGLYRDHVKKIIELVVENAELIGVEITEFSPRNSSEREQSIEAIVESFSELRKQ